MFRACVEPAITSNAQNPRHGGAKDTSILLLSYPVQLSWLH